MKKLILFGIIMLFCISSVSALVVYTGAPSLPYIIYGHVNWNSQPLTGTRLEISNQNTGYSTVIVTNEEGYWQEEGSNWLTTSSARPPILFGDSIQVKALDGCGTGDTCAKTFSAFSSGFENYAVVDLELTGTLSCPPVSCPSCSGGGGGSGCTEVKCKSYYPELCSVKEPCPVTECPVQICPNPTKTQCNSLYPSGACPVYVPGDKECPVSDNTPPICPDCSAATKSTNYVVTGVIAVLFAIAGLVLGGYSWFPGLKGLANYNIQQGLKLIAEGKYEEGQKKIDTGLKIMKTAVEKAKSGAYDK